MQLQRLGASRPCCSLARPSRIQKLLCRAQTPVQGQGNGPTGRPRPLEPPAQAVAVAASLPLSSKEEHHITCVANGTDGVQCFLDEDDRPTRSSMESVDMAADAGPTSLVEQLVSTALLISPFFFWGTSMVAMKGTLAEGTSPLIMGSFRLLPAGLLLVAWAAMQGRPMPKGAAAWAWIAAFGLIDGAAFQGFLAEGLQRCPAGLGSVIIDSQPLTVAVLAALLFGESLTPLSVLGLLIGVAGLLLLELPEQYLTVLLSGGLDDLNMLDGLSQSPEAFLQLVAAVSSPSALLSSGEFWMLAAAQAMAVGTIMVRWVTKHSDPVMATGWHMVLGGAVLLGMVLAQDPGSLPQAIQGLTPGDALSALYVSIFGGAVSYGVFFWMASTRGNLTSLSSLTFLTPVFASLGGYLVLDEVLTAPQLLGGAVTLGAVGLINSKKPAPAKKSSRSPEQQASAQSK